METTRDTESSNHKQNKNFSKLSVEITKKLTKEEKKSQGIFFTPKSISVLLLKSLKNFIDPNKSYDIVEPSCGSGEMINETLNQMNVRTIIGIEKNLKIFENIQSSNLYPSVQWLNRDFLDTNEHPDLFIGNPPYVVIKKSDVPKVYQKFMDGRPNLFVLFIIHSLHLLKDNGFLCFVIPSSFLNSSYYQKTRRYICENFTICDILPFEQNDFIETQQPTIGLIIQKKKDDGNRNKIFTLNIEEQILLFDTNTKERLVKLFEKSTSLKNLGLKVKTGPVVWNQNKELLTNTPSPDDVVLIYNSNIKTSKFQVQTFKDKNKKQFITNNSISIDTPMIIVNRGNGNSKYAFHHCFLPSRITFDGQERKYVIENHLNMILGSEERLIKVMESFKDPRTKEFLDLYCANNGLSKTEIESILPIYI
jgi:adenine-specific DNA-methyltransferase